MSWKHHFFLNTQKAKSQLKSQNRKEGSHGEIRHLESYRHKAKLPSQSSGILLPQEHKTLMWVPSLFLLLLKIQPKIITDKWWRKMNLKVFLLIFFKWFNSCQNVSHLIHNSVVYYKQHKNYIIVFLKKRMSFLIYKHCAEHCSVAECLPSKCKTEFNP
jgi:hypothetical protein